MSYYISKAKDSFRTRLNLYIYSCVMNRIPVLSFSDFKQFSISEALVLEYATVYWQELVSFKIGDFSIAEIQNAIGKIKQENDQLFREFEKSYVTEIFPAIFPQSDFDVLTKNTHCSYCGITEDDILKLANLRKLRKKNLRGWRLEMDRLDSNYEYTPQNCVMCCYWCNNAKTDEFTPEEFRLIGAAIRDVWQKRLNDDQFRLDRFSDDGSGITIITQ